MVSELLLFSCISCISIPNLNMEPQFINGQIVWVKQQNYLEDGEIGIFFLDGSGYIKKLQDNKDGHNLISLNKAYKPIPIVEDSNFMIFGKVIG